MKIAIVTDAWLPQTNGVVRTLMSLRRELAALGHDVLMITPEQFTTIPCPTYAEIRLALVPGFEVERLLSEARPDAIHIVTEGPLGLAARRYCQRHRFSFTTSFHTKFPDYIEARFYIPSRWTYELLRRFHAAASSTMVATESIRRELESHGFTQLSRWTRGVDLTTFRPIAKPATDFKRPIFLYVGRIAVEKNLPAFLDLDLPGTKLLVGDGPARAELQQRYPDARFVGRQEGEDLAFLYGMSDVFVFPSQTDTFGLVLLEALASGLPIAAFPVAGPIDIVEQSGVGVLDWNLREAALKALDIDPEACRARAQEFTWGASAAQFLSNLALVR
ncbi:MAG TPA: glycosyltransferase family 1 protein [Aliidongia sp.]|nr:glycosyltransferase family 1 protein [Aliidongia sp.]